MGRYRQWGSWTERGVILNADGMLRELHIVSWETIPDGRSQCCDLETMVSRLECTRVHFVQVSVSVSRPDVQGLGLGLET